MKKLYTILTLSCLLSAVLVWKAEGVGLSSYNLFSSIPVKVYDLIYSSLNIDVFKLSSDINVSTNCEYPIAFSENNSGLIFISETKTYDGTVKNVDFLFSRYDDINASWTKPINISSNYNAFLEENKKMGFKDIFITKDNDIYNISLGSEIFKLNRLNINSESKESSPCLSPDGFTLYFTSDRPGGYGGKDLYSSEKLSNGNWSEPFNLGPMVNTNLDEDCPYILNDGVTLYFCSKGHNSMGGYDIFNSTMNYDGNWIKPDNAGAPINSKNDDLYYVSDTYGKQAYYSSDKLQKGNQDIYSIVYTLNK